MKFIKVIEDFETFDSNEGMVTKNIPSFINLENVDLIRKIRDNSLSVFLVGRDKAMKITDKDSIDRVCKATGINKLDD